MRASVQKWGNSLALRIPKAFAVSSDLSEGAEVELSIEAGRIIVTPVTSWKSQLQGLVDLITDENRHSELLDGPSVGEEFRWSEGSGSA